MLIILNFVQFYILNVLIIFIILGLFLILINKNSVFSILNFVMTSFLIFIFLLLVASKFFTVLSLSMFLVLYFGWLYALFLVVVFLSKFVIKFKSLFTDFSNLFKLHAFVLGYKHRLILQSSVYFGLVFLNCVPPEIVDITDVVPEEINDPVIIGVPIHNLDPAMVEPPFIVENNVPGVEPTEIPIGPGIIEKPPGAGADWDPTAKPPGLGKPVEIRTAPSPLEVIVFIGLVLVGVYIIWVIVRTSPDDKKGNDNADGDDDDGDNGGGSE